MMKNGIWNCNHLTSNRPESFVATECQVNKTCVELDSDGIFKIRLGIQLIQSRRVVGCCTVKTGILFGATNLEIRPFDYLYFEFCNAQNQITKKLIDIDILFREKINNHQTCYTVFEHRGENFLIFGVKAKIFLFPDPEAKAGGGQVKNRVLGRRLKTTIFITLHD